MEVKLTAEELMEGVVLEIQEVEWIIQKMVEVTQLPLMRRLL